MAVKISGFEWKKFYEDKTVWPEGAYHDDDTITGSDGVDYSCNADNIPVDVTITLEGGAYYKTKDTPPGDSQDLEKVFKKWRKAQKVEYLIVESPKECRERLNTFLKSIGAKIK